MVALAMLFLSCKKGHETKNIPLDVYEYHSSAHLVETENLLANLNRSGQKRINGYKNLMNYDDFWVEWSYDENLPIEKDSLPQ